MALAGCVAQAKCGNLWVKWWITSSVRGKLGAKTHQSADELQAQEGDTKAEGDNLSPSLAYPRWLEQRKVINWYMKWFWSDPERLPASIFLF